jgi:hypothetical protein|tara:strand:- start:548 stop:946 length:399 start_codon:yes stop_codon:yes gene_type:complete
MQTFLPFSSFAKSARCLDYRRLGKQRVEALQVLNTLSGKTTGWANHPATRMWAGYENALAFYKDICIEEWERRGYRNTMQRENYYGGIVLPQWFGRDDFHASHRSNLLRKNPDFYCKLGWTEPDDLPYVWPV